MINGKAKDSIDGEDVKPHVLRSRDPNALPPSHREGPRGAWSTVRGAAAAWMHLQSRPESSRSADKFL